MWNAFVNGIAGGCFRRITKKGWGDGSSLQVFNLKRLFTESIANLHVTTAPPLHPPTTYNLLT